MKRKLKELSFLTNFGWRGFSNLVEQSPVKIYGYCPKYYDNIHDFSLGDLEIGFPTEIFWVGNSDTESWALCSKHHETMVLGANDRPIAVDFNNLQSVAKGTQLYLLNRLPEFSDSAVLPKERLLQYAKSKLITYSVMRLNRSQSLEFLKLWGQTKFKNIPQNGELNTDNILTGSQLQIVAIRAGLYSTLVHGDFGYKVIINDISEKQPITQIVPDKNSYYFVEFKYRGEPVKVIRRAVSSNGDTTEFF